MVSTVLVVESHADLRTVIVEALTRAHYRCDAVANPGDALLKLRESDYSCILVDVDAPTPMTAFCDALAASPAWRSKLVVISDEADEAPHAVADRPQLHKPFDRRDLLARLRR